MRSPSPRPLLGRLAPIPTLGLLLSLAVGCGGAGAPEDPAPASDASSAATELASPPAGDDATGAPAFDEPIFVEQAAALGIDFAHDNGMSGQRYFPEVNGPGGALFDYDGDGDLDLYLVQGGSLEQGPDPALADRLYRNRLVEDGRLAFEDVTEAAGIQATGYGMGVAAGDVDNDGDIDLYLANFGPNQLWLNQGDGSFREGTAAAGEGVDDPRWSTSAAFLDYDRDGWLDLVVVNYTDFTMATHKPCYAPNGAIDYCGPLSYDPVPDRLLHGRGDGSFEEVTAAAGLGAAYGAGLGVTVADWDDNGWPDVFVANDGMANQLWLNQDGQRFEDRALLAGVAMNAEGAAEAGMGVVTDDFDGDGDLDLFMTHLTDETNTFYRNDGRAIFEDATQRLGLGAASLAYTGFGVGSLDFDGDGWLDILVSNGAVRINPRQAGMAPDPDDPLAPYRMPRQLYRNQGEGRFEELQGDLGLGGDALGRGAVFGDLDDDGDPDAVLTDNQGPTAVLINQLGPPADWLGLRVLTRSGRDAYGARLRFELDSGRTLLRLARADGSHLASNDPRVLLPLAPGERVTRLRIDWPEGEPEVWSGDQLPLGRYGRLQQGDGQVP